jgi:butyrate kinase
LVDKIKNRIAFMNTSIFSRPDENEMQALAEDAYRVLVGEETVHTYEG